MANATEATMTRRHGVHVKKHKHWNTKTIYNDGHVMHIFRHVPNEIQFVSPMVNDFNQHLCGGWSMSDIGDSREAIMRQLITRKKPFGEMHFRKDSDAVAGQLRLAAAGLVTTLQRSELPWGDSEYGWDLQACQDIKVNDIGDLTALRADYFYVFKNILEQDDIMSFADRPLSSFFDGWDTPPLPMWLTGLILGYPIENTLANYFLW